MRRFWILSFCLILVLGLANSSLAHFGLLLPDKPVVMAGDNQDLGVTLAFVHPMEQKGMPMYKPQKFGVQIGDLNKDLTGTLQETSVLNNIAWKGLYTIQKPGIYAFYFVPQPYWEPAEEKYIIHMTKVYVPGLGYEEDWDKMVGLKAEIQPLTRPFGLYAGNVFKGIVKFKGKPLPEADVEVEYWNAGNKVEPPNDYFVTQVVKTDDNGVFTFAPTKAGWWGFAGLAEEKSAIRHVDGRKKTAEYGAVIWVYFNEQPAVKQPAAK